MKKIRIDLFRRRTRISFSHLFAIALVAFSTAQNRHSPPPALTQPADCNQPMLPNRLNQPLLEQTLLYCTNRTRQKHHLHLLRANESLHRAASAHSKEMAILNYFDHESPVKENRQLMDRLKNACLPLGNTMFGENIGVDYFLKIAKVGFYTEYAEGEIRYINAETKEPIPYQTYLEFASSMVNGWMKSPGHRKNLLHPIFHSIGIGVQAGTFRGLPALYVTQNFIGPIEPKEKQ